MLSAFRSRPSTLPEDTLTDGETARPREEQLNKAESLFRDRKYQPALDLLADAQASVDRVLQLFPHFIAGDLSATRNEDQSNGIQEGDNLEAALLALCSYLAHARRRVKKYLIDDGTFKKKPTVLDPDTHRPAFANLLPESLFKRDNGSSIDIDYEDEMVKVAQLVDTTLFRSYMLVKHNLVGSLVRVPNHCDLDTVQRALDGSKRHGDLIDFLHGKQLHRRALEMLQKFGKGEAESGAGEEEDFHGPERTVAYLKRLPPEMIDLTLEFVQWPIEVDPELGLSVFTADSERAECMDRRRVIEFFANSSPSLERQYLEHILDEWHDTEPDFHQRLVGLYIEQMIRSRNASEEVDRIMTTKTKLENFLRSSRQYNHRQTFRLLDANEPWLYESRAIVLAAMGNYREALSIYLYQICDHQKAEELCGRVYLQQQQHIEAAADDNVFATLLGLYLQPPPGEQENWPQAFELLRNHASRFLISRSTLALIPDEVSVQQLQAYFLTQIRHSTTSWREDRIVQGLERE